MLDDAALALEEIEPEDKTRTEVLGAQVVLYIAAKKWDMAAAVASHLVKVEPENEAWWINLAYSVRRSEGIEQAEAILLRARAIHPKVAMIAFNLATDWHKPHDFARSFKGSAKAIAIDPEFGTLCGASDPRLDGVAIGY